MSYKSLFKLSLVQTAPKMKDRKLAAKLAEEYNSGAIEYKHFMTEYPDNEDNDIFELFGLIVQKPASCSFREESKNKENERTRCINDLISKLKQ
jgi:hypothetical protein